MRRLGVVLLAVLLGGCSGTTSADGSDDAASTSVSDPFGTADQPSGTAYPDTAMTEEDLTSALDRLPHGPPRSADEALRGYWQSLRLDGDPPEVAVVRTVRPDEVDAAVQECLAEQGFASTDDGQGQVGIEFGADQHDALKLADYVCHARYPIDDLYLQPFSVEQLRTIYDWMVDETLPCMVADGVTPPQPPSFETFVARYAKMGYELWSPHQEVEPPPALRDRSGVLSWCPDRPPDEVLYGTGPGPPG